MDFERIKGWLQGKTNKEIRVRLMLAILGLALAPFGIVAGAFVVAVFALMVARNSDNPNVAATCMWVGLASIPVLFLINYLIPRGDKKDVYYHEEADTSVVGMYKTRQRVKVQVILWILFTGPRLVNWAIFSFKRAAQLKRQDTHSCAAVIWLLLAKGRRLTYQDIQAELDWVDVENTMSQLGWVPGLLFIKRDPPAVSLTDDLRAEIRKDLLGLEPVQV